MKLSKKLFDQIVTHEKLRERTYHRESKYSENKSFSYSVSEYKQGEIELKIELEVDKTADKDEQERTLQVLLAVNERPVEVENSEEVLNWAVEYENSKPEITEELVAETLSKIGVEEDRPDKYEEMEKELAPGGDFDKFADLLVKSPGFEKIWNKIATTLLANTGE